MSSAENPWPGGIVPEEIRRLRLEPGETLIVRVNDLSPSQAQQYQECLEYAFPGVPVRVIHGEEILVAKAEDGTDA